MRAFTGPKIQNLKIYWVHFKPPVLSYSEVGTYVCDWSSTQVSLFLLTELAGIMNVQGCGMHLSTLTQSQAPSPILLKVYRNFKEGQHFD